MYGRTIARGLGAAALASVLAVGSVARAQDVLVRKVTDDRPGSFQCTDPASLRPGSPDVNNMPQGEVMIDVSPSGTLAATAKDNRYGPASSTIYNDHVWSGLYWSDDGGGAWRNLTDLDRTPYQGIDVTTSGAYGLPGGERVTIFHESDPVVAFDREGNLYTNSLVYSPDAPEPDIFGMPAGFSVSRRDPSGRLVEGTTHWIGIETSPMVFGDKNWIAVDRDAPRDRTAVVVTWRVFAAGAAPVPEGAYLAVSGDGASSFSGPIRVALPAFEQDRSLTYQPLIGRDRVTGRKTLYIFFRLNADDLFETRMHIVKADIDGIVGTEALAAHLERNASWVHLPDRIVGVQRFGSNGFDGAFRFGSYFMPAMDATTGELFAVTHGFNQSRQGSRVLVSRSTDGGVTWAAPVAVDDPSSGNQFMPTVAASHGVVSVLWYDSRHDPSFAPLQLMQAIDAYYAELTPSLETIRVIRLTPESQTANHPVFTRTRNPSSSADARIQQEGLIRALPEDVPRPRRGVTAAALSPEPYGFIGDYIGLAANDRFAYAVWTDLRDLDTSVDIRAGSSCDGRRNQNIYFARIRK